MNETVNLTDPLDILYALKKKGGSLTALARKHGLSLPYMSQTMHGLRNNTEVLKHFANFLGCPVRGIKPDSLPGKKEG